MCTLLLGSPEAALVTLRLRRGGVPRPADPAVAAFMAEYGESSSEQISGVCDFGERWVQRVLGPQIVQYDWTKRFDLYEWAKQPAVCRHACPDPCAALCKRGVVEQCWAGCR